MKVLVVDDEPLMKQWIECILKQDSRCIIVHGEASNGKQALEICKRDPPDVIFTDIRMPGMDGVELIQILHETFPQIISVVLSNYSEYQFVRQTMLNGAFDYILKLETKEEDILEILNRIYKTYIITKEERKVRLDTESTPEEQLGFGKQIREAILYIRQNYEKDLSRSEVAEYVHFNENYFSDIFKRETGVGFISYLTMVRMEKAQWLLCFTDNTVAQIAEKTGYPDAGYFSKAFRKYVGVSPVEFRQKKYRKKNDQI